MTDPTAPELKKLTSLNLCHSGLYQRKSILSFSTLHLKKMYAISVYFGMVIQLLTTISLLFNGFDQAAGGLDEGSDVDLFFSLKASPEH